MPALESGPCKNHCVEAPEPEIVDWPSLLSALFIDSLLVWGPAATVFLSAPGSHIPIALGMVLATLVVNCALYTRGTTLGIYLAGFRLRPGAGSHQVWPRGAPYTSELPAHTGAWGSDGRQLHSGQQRFSPLGEAGEAIPSSESESNVGVSTSGG